MKKVLVVDDSEAVLSLLENELSKYDYIEPIFAKTYKEAMKKIRENKGRLHAALLDLHLPDASEGEIVALANSHHIPAVILTSTLTSDIKDSILQKDIVDCVSKNDPSSIRFAVNSILRTLKNHNTTVMVVDDSKLYRQTLVNNLKRIHLNVIEAENGQEALDILTNGNQKISLVITDYEMPLMNGLELTFRIREIYKKDQLGIIAASSSEKQDVITKFLKFGANDFIHKPYTSNEVVTRINSNLELLDLFSQIKDMANKDFLTGLSNRRYFLESGKHIYQKEKRKMKNLAVAMLDIDGFKNINDTYGHAIGDIAIKEVKKVLKENLRVSDLIARFGGEEFCILLEDISLEDTKILFEKIRKSFEENTIFIGDIRISYTMSIGIYYGLSSSLNEMIDISDKALFHSKTNGKNQVTINSNYEIGK